jgi:transcriptional regulator with XRE-family HTH domain
MADMLAENFRANVKLRRKDLRWTQAQLAERLGVTDAYVAQLESRPKSPTTDLIERVAQALKINPLMLLQEPVLEETAST